MKKGLSVLLVLVVWIGTVAVAFGSTEMAEPNGGSATGLQEGSPYLSTIRRTDMDSVGPRMDYPQGLDRPGPVISTEPEPGQPLPVDEARMDLIVDTGAVLLYEDPSNDDVWLPLPTRDDISQGRAVPVSFENGSMHEIHGKLFGISGIPNITYLDDIGIPDMPIEIEFDGTPVSLIGITGNGTTVIDPFIGTGNGTFQFVFDIDKPAGEYELKLIFDGTFPPELPQYDALTYRTVVYVNHPTVIDVDVTPTSVTVGDPVTVSGSLSDDTGLPITSVGLQVRLDDVLLGPTSAGVYLDDVRVTGADFFDDFEDDDGPVWSSYAVPGRGVADQWMRGSPVGSVGPLAPHSGSNLYGTNLADEKAVLAWDSFFGEARAQPRTIGVNFIWKLR